MCIQPPKQAFLVIYTKESSAALCMVIELSFMLFFLFPYVVFVCFPFKWQPRRRAALHVGCGTIHWSGSVVSLEKRERAPVIISLCLCLYVSLCGVCVCVRQSLRGLLRVNGKSNASVKASTVALLLLLILFHYMRV